MKALSLGILASCFFAITFILNRSMSLSGGNWAWSASLRYFFTVPFLFILVGIRGSLRALFIEMRAHLASWLIWSSVGFGLFYAPLTFVSTYNPGWLTAATWQITIIAGTLLVPFLNYASATPDGHITRRMKMPFKGLLLSLIILLGVAIMQIDHSAKVAWPDVLFGSLPVVLAAFAYPLGNRQMMNLCQNRLDVFQRVLGMTLASLPFWLILSCFGFATSGPPNGGQVLQSLVIAISSGVIATLLFFKATDMASDDMKKLGAVEATQAGEVLFTILGECLLLKDPFPSLWSWLGIGLVILGMVCHSYFSHRASSSSAVKTKEISPQL